MEHMLFVTLQSRYMKSDTGHKRKAPHVDFVLIKIQDFVVFLVFFQVHILRGKQRFVILCMRRCSCPVQRRCRSVTKQNNTRKEQIKLENLNSGMALPEDSGKKASTYVILFRTTILHMTEMRNSWRDQQRLQTVCGANYRNSRKKSVQKAAFWIWRQTL